MLPISAKWQRLIGLQSAFAPQSIKITFPPVLVGSVGASAGLDTPFILPIFKKPPVRTAPVLPPDINKSNTFFTVKNGVIRFGLCAVRGLGEAICNQIVEERNKNGDYKDLGDFITRTVEFNINKRVLEGMIYSGAFDCFNKHRSQMAAVFESAINCVKKDKEKTANGQFSMFGDLFTKEESLKIDYPNISEYDLKTKLKKEK